MMSGILVAKVKQMVLQDPVTETEHLIQGLVCEAAFCSVCLGSYCLSQRTSCPGTLGNVPSV